MTAALLLGLLAAPLAAEPMTQEQCDQSWTAFAEVLELSPSDRILEQAVTPQGWCMIKGDGEFEDKGFTAFRWRAEGVDAAIEQRVPPRKFQLELDDIDLAESLGLIFAPDTEVARGMMALSVTHDPDIRRGLIEEFRIDLGGLGDITLLAAARNIDFSNHNAMLISLGSSRLEEVQFELKNQGFLRQSLLPTLEMDAKALRERLSSLVSALPSDTLIGESQSALDAMLDALPDAKGRLRIVARSPNGLGVQQISMGMWQLAENPLASTESNDALALLLDGVTFEILWTPQQ